MKKQKLALLSILLIFTLFVPTSTSVFADSNSQYNRRNASAYARNYALNPNPSFYNYEGGGNGGDCTNFASQVLKSGGIAMTPQKSSPTYADWYYNGPNLPARTSTWTGAHEFRQYFGNVSGSGYNHAAYMEKYTVSDFYKNWNKIYMSTWEGDIIQFVSAIDGRTTHSVPISGFTTDGNYGILVSYRSITGMHKLDRNLSEYLQKQSSSDYVVILHIKNGG